MKTALSIAGSDSSGGAGIQADLKTFQATGTFGMSAITAITAQNTLGVQASEIVSPELLEAQIRSVCDDIRPDAVKIGMVGNADSIRCIARLVQEYQLDKLVLDPVMVATSGASLLASDQVQSLQEDLIPLAKVITPNLSETSVLYGQEVTDEASMEEAAKALSDRYQVAVLVKGGHLQGKAWDVLADANGLHWLQADQVDNPNTHGTGCTLSSAIASYLAQGYPLKEAIQKAKSYLTGAIAAGLDLGQGHGPLNHAYQYQKN
ncbi:bifunctional hydroxymethylpyrimidine kinase/phosphomethylpyrimidine kinase [Aerococcus sanguinicola]|uniref:Hydroxymethylpyrimidine/phosphomethylpyrimidine kinase n=1 Tax=Aerococcus sanguinicola TaxID=119206 RepID=A0A2I1MQ73_9LACT|nr:MULTISPECIES: bifunctional hydroxymethylpyrimidine kinase/phosphomethylpyrimidine kinase [Aerococcus]MDK7050127.1 bifunctional hydroxymethylpyrimidine kinase/phosphomethylpyrimidine kinase [Aerococcus sanguinicola]OFT93326.1 hydroxymethylpyrimidine/phosphomethylpyrimidine kinase [Aerococcus sp. HMSC23C02]PKZ22269.1 bifunctional hydroxymethylpyrimidine kinase/phosphomethylpyrimidine kinase [Aerococcus sanguinicola]